MKLVRPRKSERNQGGSVLHEARVVYGIVSGPDQSTAPLVCFRVLLYIWSLGNILSLLKTPFPVCFALY